MKKHNGFILVETIVVMSVVMIALLGLYNTYVSVIKKSTQKAYYDNINDVYRLNVITKLVDTSVNSYNEGICTTTNNCTSILNSLVPSDSGTTKKVILIPSGFNITNSTQISNTLLKYLQSTDYNYNKLIILNYTYNGKERFASLEVE